MALTEPGMPCSLCGKPIQDPDVDTFCTTAHVKLHSHPDFCILNDAAVHQACIDSWARREDFMTFYNTEVENRLIVDPHDHVKYRRRHRNHVAEFFFVSAIVAFVWLFLFAGVYNAITLKSVDERTASQQRIVALLSFFDDGDESLYFPGDLRYTASLIGIPVALASLGIFFHLRDRKQPAA